MSTKPSEPMTTLSELLKEINDCYGSIEIYIDANRPCDKSSSFSFSSYPGSTLFGVVRELEQRWHNFRGDFKPQTLPNWQVWAEDYRSRTSESASCKVEDIIEDVKVNNPGLYYKTFKAWEAFTLVLHGDSWVDWEIERFNESRSLTADKFAEYLKEGVKANIRLQRPSQENKEISLYGWHLTHKLKSLLLEEVKAFLKTELELGRKYNFKAEDVVERLMKYMF